MHGQLDVEDLIQVVQLIAEAANPDVNLSPHERRVAIIRSLNEVIDADVWNWVTGVVNPSKDSDAMVTSSLDGGFRDETERADFFRLALHPEMLTLVARFFLDGIKAQVPVTHARSEVISDEMWAASPMGTAFTAAGFDDFIIATHPLSSSTHTAVGFHRRVGRPRFTSREEAIVHAVFQHVRWLHATHVPAEAHAVVTLSPRERQVAIFLMDGDSRKEIARKLGISQHTVTDYLKEIYRKFDVSSRGELLAKFVRREVDR